LSDNEALDTQICTPQPFLKWAGGKRGLLPEISSRIPRFSGTYFEPFLGAGAVFFDQSPGRKKIVSDSNRDLIEVYEVIRDNCGALIEALSTHKNTKEHYYAVRGWDREDDFSQKWSKVERAARFIFLNKTTFNGLYRVNARGQMNVPFGSQSTANWVQRDVLTAVSRFLGTRDPDGNLTAQLSSGDYREITRLARPGDFVYLDPPYAGTFTHYQSGGFGPAQQEELRDEILRLSEAGVPVLLSNSDVPLVHELFSNEKGLTTEYVGIRRMIGASKESRVRVREVLVNNFHLIGEK